MRSATFVSPDFESVTVPRPGRCCSARCRARAAVEQREPGHEKKTCAGLVGRARRPHTLDMPIETAAAETASIARAFEATLPEPVAMWLADKLGSLAKRARRLGQVEGLALVLSEPRVAWRRWRERREASRDCDTCKTALRSLDLRHGAQSWGSEAWIAEDPGCGHWEPVVLRDVLVSGSLPTLNGWTLVAAIDFERSAEGREVIVRQAPGGGDLPAAYYGADARPVCEHCSKVRSRHTCYVLRGEGGKLVQVGASCLADYVRSADAAQTANFLTQWAAVIAEAAGKDEEDTDLGGYRGSCARSLERLLACVAAFVRVEGAYVTAKAADGGRTPTARKALRLLTDPARSRQEWPDVDVTGADGEKAKRAIAWARETYPRGCAASPFEANLGTLARIGYVEPGQESLAAYMVEAYRKALGEAQAHTARPKAPEARHLAAKIGERVEFDAEVVRIGSYQTAYGTTYVTTLRRLADGAVGTCPAASVADEGAVVVWKSKEGLWLRGAIGAADEQGNPQDGGWVAASPGDRVRVRATVKAHTEYKGQPQTEVSRVERLCDGWGFAAEPGTPEAQARDAAIASGRNAPPKRAKARKAKVAPQAADEATDALFALP